ncbi:sin3b-related [Anaeramoeba ignava]|uniref:Sin3b-related n=1 Tax=Anaeramoeba ignava TaxID=1746090 RepID=A0A9Q0LUD5_ANAIG|nr:sin3b-related [Anaeramoeba ignava]
MQQNNEFNVSNKSENKRDQYIPQTTHSQTLQHTNMQTRTTTSNNQERTAEKDNAQTNTSDGNEMKNPEAVEFLGKIRDYFSNNEQKMQTFLEILREFKYRRQDTPSVIAKIIQIFEGDTDLLMKFNRFLPSDYKITEAHINRKDNREFLKFIHFIEKTLGSTSTKWSKFVRKLKKLQKGTLSFQEFQQKMNKLFSDNPAITKGFTQSFFEKVHYVQLPFLKPLVNKRMKKNTEKAWEETIYTSAKRAKKSRKRAPKPQGLEGTEPFDPQEFSTNIKAHCQYLNIINTHSALLKTSNTLQSLSSFSSFSHHPDPSEQLDTLSGLVRQRKKIFSKNFKLMKKFQFSIEKMNEILELILASKQKNHDQNALNIISAKISSLFQYPDFCLLLQHVYGEKYESMFDFLENNPLFAVPSILRNLIECYDDISTNQLQIIAETDKLLSTHSSKIQDLQFLNYSKQFSDFLSPSFLALDTLEKETLDLPITLEYSDTKLIPTISQLLVIRLQQGILGEDSQPKNQKIEIPKHIHDNFENQLDFLDFQQDLQQEIQQEIENKEQNTKSNQIMQMDLETDNALNETLKQLTHFFFESIGASKKFIAYSSDEKRSKETKEKEKEKEKEDGNLKPENSPNIFERPFDFLSTFFEEDSTTNPTKTFQSNENENSNENEIQSETQNEIQNETQNERRQKNVPNSKSFVGDIHFCCFIRLHYILYEIMMKLKNSNVSFSEVFETISHFLTGEMTFENFYSWLSSFPSVSQIKASQIRLVMNQILHQVVAISKDPLAKLLFQKSQLDQQKIQQEVDSPLFLFTTQKQTLFEQLDYEPISITIRTLSNQKN